MIKLKGSAEVSEHQKMMGRALGLPPAEQKKPDDPEPTAASFDLGMPSAKKWLDRQQEKARRNVDWGAHENRIDVGRQVFIKGKTEQARERKVDREVVGERRRAIQEAQELQQSELQSRRAKSKALGQDSDSDLDLSDDEEILAADRAKRLAEWKSQHDRRQQLIAAGHGKLTEVKEAEFLPSVTGAKQVVCHFYHTEFERCKLMDQHLTALSKAHLETRFIKIDADKAPFFVQKLQIRILPTLVSFREGIAVHRQVGFEGLGDGFGTAELERLLARRHRIIEDPVPAAQRLGFIQGSGKKDRRPQQQQQRRLPGTSDLEDSEGDGGDAQDDRLGSRSIRRGRVGGRMQREGSDWEDDDSDSD